MFLVWILLVCVSILQARLHLSMPEGQLHGDLKSGK